MGSRFSALRLWGLKFQGQADSGVAHQDMGPLTEQTAVYRPDLHSMGPALPTCPVFLPPT